MAVVFTPALFFAGFSRGGLCARPGMLFVPRAPGFEVFRLGLSQRFVPFFPIPLVGCPRAGGVDFSVVWRFLTFTSVEINAFGSSNECLVVMAS
jgi:hypothetical protein